MYEQTKIESLIEALLNTLIGYVLNLGVQLVIYPFFGATFTFQQNITIGLIFMVVSLSRSYLIRRWCIQYLRQVSHFLAVKFTSK